MAPLDIAPYSRKQGPWVSIISSGNIGIQLPICPEKGFGSYFHRLHQSTFNLWLLQPVVQLCAIVVTHVLALIRNFEVCGWDFVCAPVQLSLMSHMVKCTRSSTLAGRTWERGQHASLPWFQFCGSINTYIFIDPQNWNQVYGCLLQHYQSQSTIGNS